MDFTCQQHGIILLLIFLRCVTVTPKHVHYHFLPCKTEDALAEREKRADVVITGTVLNLISAEQNIILGSTHVPYKGQIAVKRVIKGHPPAIQSMSLILVENFGDPAVCDSHVVKRDTKIFLLTRNPASGNFRLNSSVIKLTLKNLDKISAYVKGYSFSTRAPFPERPCEKMYCGQSSTCKINATTGAGFCRELEDPCRNSQCHYGATCVGNYLTGRSQCICPATCDAFPNIDMRPTVYVCGSDNITYDNHCQLRLTSCKEQRPINVESIGVCGGCQRKQCDFYSTCEVDARGAPKCACPTSCRSQRQPVCGVDGITYDSECELRKTACEQRRFIVVAAPYPCESIPSSVQSSTVDYETDGEDAEENGSGRAESSEPDIPGVCEETTCVNFGGKCSADRNNRMRCLCKFNCSLTMGSVVCGSSAADGSKRLFTNDCFLKEHACQQMKHITSRPAAECEEVDILPCYGSKPLKNNMTREDMFCGDGAKSEECPMGSFCHKSISTSYAKCCPQESALTGDCTTSEWGCCPDGITSSKGHHSFGCRKPAGVPDESCKCNKIGALVTSCDEETKQCKCKLGVGGSRCDRCQPGFWGLQKAISASKGCIPCACSNFGAVRPDCEQMTGRCVCKPGVLGLKCDRCPDGQILQPAGCVSADSYPMQPSSCGELLCHLGAICVQRNGHTECLCNMTCREHESPQVVCGSDGMTYASVCQLRLHACRFQKDITIVAWGPCGEVNGDDSIFSAGQAFVTLPSLTATPQQDDMNLMEGQEPISNHIVRDTEVQSPSVPRKTHGFLGEFCDRDTDCVVKHSKCPRGKCTCVDGYDPLFDKQECQRIKTTTKSACTTERCQNGGTCKETHPGFECLCATGFSGKSCDETSFTTVPSFGGRSYFELRPITGGYTQLTIEMEFQTHSLDGVLLYNGQKADGSGDFVSLTLNNGFVEFRYDLGDGAALIRSTVPVTPGARRHRVVAKRFNQDGMLKLDDNPEVLGKCPGVHKYLDLDESLFVGFVPSSSAMIFDKMGVKTGFLGCMFSTKVGKKVLGLNDPDFRDTIAAFEIGECGANICASGPCQNGGICQAAAKMHQYTCTCQEGFSGNQCEISSALRNSAVCTNCHSSHSPKNNSFVYVCPDGSHSPNCDSKASKTPSMPDFYGSSFVQLPRISDANPQLNIELWFLSRSHSGLLMYTGRLLTGEGDFISLNLHLGKLEFLFDLGDGPVNITYPDEVSLSTWHSAKVFRHGKRASLQLDSGAPVSGESQGTLAELNLELATYVGGVRNLSHLVKAAKIDTLLNGAVQLVSINGRQWNDFSRQAVELHNIRPYRGLPCHSEEEQCLHGGLCIPRLSKFRCKCPPLYGGERCERELVKNRNSPVQEKAVHFDAHTLLEFPNAISKSFESQEKNLYRLRFKTKAANGLLLWQSKGKHIRGDYFSIAIVNERVQMSYDLGKEQDLFVIQSQIIVNDGNWHTIIAERLKRWGSLQVDDESPQTNTSSPGTTALNTNGKLYIGGSTELPPGFAAAYYQGFDGCLAEFYIENERLTFFKDGDTNGIALCSEDVD